MPVSMNAKLLVRCIKWSSHSTGCPESGLQFSHSGGLKQYCKSGLCHSPELVDSGFHNLPNPVEPAQRLSLSLVSFLSSDSVLTGML